MRKKVNPKLEEIIHEAQILNGHCEELWDYIIKNCDTAEKLRNEFLEGSGGIICRIQCAIRPIVGDEHDIVDDNKYIEVRRGVETQISKDLGIGTWCVSNALNYHDNIHINPFKAKVIRELAISRGGVVKIKNKTKNE